MSNANQLLQTAYGLSQAILPQAPIPIIAKRAPTTADINYYPGQIWTEGKSSAGVVVNTAWILTSIINNSANWQAIGGGGAGLFSSLTVNPGPTALSTVGNGAVTIGNAANTGAVTIATGTGNLSITGNGNSISIGSDANANSVTVGSVTNGSLLDLQGGNGAGVGSSAITLATAVAGSIQIGLATQTGAIYLGTSTAGNTVNIATGINAGAQVVNIATGASAANNTVNILSGAPTAGTATVNVGTGAYATQVNLGSATGGNRVNIASNPFQIAGPVFVYTGAGAPAGGSAAHVGDLYINTTAASSTTRLYIATAVGSWANITCAG